MLKSVVKTETCRKQSPGLFSSSAWSVSYRYNCFPGFWLVIVPKNPDRSLSLHNVYLYNDVSYCFFSLWYIMWHFDPCILALNWCFIPVSLGRFRQEITARMLLWVSPTMCYKCLCSGTQRDLHCRPCADYSVPLVWTGLVLCEDRILSAQL